MTHDSEQPFELFEAQDYLKWQQQLFHEFSRSPQQTPTILLCLLLSAPVQILQLLSPQNAPSPALRLNSSLSRHYRFCDNPESFDGSSDPADTDFIYDADTPFDSEDD
ncbi:hypothetical protein F5Y18DRAFT_424747 [Xylariaceae sp. FL1019]|nr:hypothetical protein F5Y18DRAFT_424747 [Xylariaceae sp. FL1019]